MQTRSLMSIRSSRQYYRERIFSKTNGIEANIVMHIRIIKLVSTIIDHDSMKKKLYGFFVLQTFNDHCHVSRCSYKT